jgi:hypothetical protein
VKAVILALVLVNALVLAVGISSGSPAMIVGGLFAAPSLLYLLLVAIPRAERKVDGILKGDDHPRGK